MGIPPLSTRGDDGAVLNFQSKPLSGDANLFIVPTRGSGVSRPGRPAEIQEFMRLRESRLGNPLKCGICLEVGMRIVAVADTHLVDPEPGSVPEGDVLVHAGDLMRMGTIEELISCVEWLTALPHRHKIIVAGNHDWCFATMRDQALDILPPGVVYLEDSGVTINGLNFWGSPWQPRYKDWAFNLDRGVPLREKWKLIPPTVDVLVTHSPPEGMGDRSPVPDRHGCHELRLRVLEVQPLLHVFGHIHEDGGVWRLDGITFANVTTCEGRKGATVFEVDEGKREVKVIC